MPAPRFSNDTLAFLRGLKRHNTRDWFTARRETYEAKVRAPMLAVIERLAVDLRGFAPELEASPRVSLYRIHRDTRFSADKSPFKTHVAAVFPCRGLAKHGGAGLYLEVSPEHVLIGGGIYAPEPASLYRVREHIAVNHRRLRAVVESPTFRKAFGEIAGQRLQRVPRGFDREHPAGDYLRLRQFLAGRTRPAAFAASLRFYAGVLEDFRLLAPFVRFLNEPLVARTIPAPSPPRVR